MISNYSYLDILNLKNKDSTLPWSRAKFFSDVWLQNVGWLRVHLLILKSKVELKIVALVLLKLSLLSDSVLGTQRGVRNIQVT